MSLFVGRQPILDRNERTYGYELLFRDGTENAFANIDGDEASLSVIDASFGHMSLQRMTSGRKAFVNFTRNLLLKDFIQLLPKEHLVVEILENIEPDEEIIEACTTLKKAGYTLALDDFIYDPKYDPLVKLVSIIKLDISLVEQEKWSQYVTRFKPQRIQLLAERVETQEQFLQTRELGFHYFQGYFFSRPVIVEAKQLPESKISKIQLLQEVNRADFNLDQAEAIIKHDPGLTWKLFRYVNSAIFAFRKEITSIRHALTMLGERNVRRWTIVLILSSLADDKPLELIRQAIVRARLCELLAKPAGMPDSDQELFMTGLFSHLDSMMNQPMATLLADMPIASEVKATLLGEDTRYKGILAVAKSCECTQWDDIKKAVQKYDVSEEQLSKFQQEAFDWADELAPV
jgi:EAL and modified HD-GYP domain-containing signal transduction protein